MEFVTTRENFLTTIELAARCSDPKAALPSCCNVALHASADGTVRVFATNLMRAFVGSFRAEVKLSGAVSVHAKGLVQLVQGFPNKSEITVRAEKLTAKLTAKRTKASIAGIDVEQMPSEPTIDRASGMKVDASALRAALEACAAFMSSDNTRPHLAAQCFTGSHVVATNGHTMAIMPLVAPRALVPSEAVASWIAALKGVEGEVTLFGASRALAALETTAGLFVTKVVDEAFPSWEQVVPQASAWAIEVEAADLRAAARGMPAPDGTSAVRMEMRREGMLDELVITGANDDTRRAKVASVGANVLRGADAIPAYWGLNLNYLMHALGPATGAVVIEGHGELDPFKFTARGVDGYVAVVMPTLVGSA